MRLFLLVLLPTLSFGSAGIDQLLQQKSVQDFEPIKVKRTVLNLDDPFLVQIYGSLREKGIKDQKLLDAYDLLFQKKYKASLAALDDFSGRDYVKTTQVYLLVKLGLYHTAANIWISMAKRTAFLDSQLAIALDQVIGKSASQNFINYGLFLNAQQETFLRKTKSNNIQFHDSLRGMAFLRGGKEVLEIIPYLDAMDPLRLKLADSLVLHYAKKGELANAAKVLKGVFQPVLSQSEDVEALSFYHLTLARLLYQARAFDAAWEYYQVIPDESSWFLTAQVESMWISMQKSDFGQIKGQLETLKLAAFNEEFLPERHLVSAMANLQTCQFKKVKTAFNEFLKENTQHARNITEALASDAIVAAETNNWIFKLMKNAKQSLSKEIKTLDAIGVSKVYGEAITQSLKLLEQMRIAESRRQWENRQKILETAIYHMRFVKVEYLSTMRRLNSKLALMEKNMDQVSRKSAGINKQENFVFPFDGLFFADELFKINSAVRDLCLKERSK